MAASAAKDETIAAMRRFNRDYTRRAGLLEESLTGSGYTLAEARVLFELGAGGTGLARDIARDLLLDPAYLTRILKRLGREGLVRSYPSAEDGRRRDLELTEAGRSALAGLQAMADAHIGGLLAHLGDGARRRLASAMEDVTTLLETPARDRQSEPIIRPHRVGDIGMIIHRQAVLYAEEYGWDISFEGLIAQIAGEFIRDFKPGREFCWVAEHRGEIAGSVFLVRQDDETAKLRLLYVEPGARGLGIGSRLVETCMTQARACGYRRIVLWTNDILVSARRIYQAAGFRLVEEEPHESFGKQLVGQNWELAL